MKKAIIAIFLFVVGCNIYRSTLPQKLGCTSQRQLKVMCTADILYDYKKTPNLNNAEKISSSDYNSISAFCECFSETIWKNKTTDKEELIKEKVYISEVINYCNEKFPINNSIIQESFTGNF